MIPYYIFQFQLQFGLTMSIDLFLIFSYLLLSSKLPSELATPKGREELAMDIRDTINEVLGYPPRPRDMQQLGPSGPVQAVLFRSFIIQ